MDKADMAYKADKANEEEVGKVDEADAEADKEEADAEVQLMRAGG